MFSMIIRFQRTDITYDSVDFDDPMSIVSYFKKLLQAFSGMPEEDVDLVVNKMMAKIIDKETKALSIMKSTADKIHGVFQELGRDDDYSTTKTTEATRLARLRKIGKNASLMTGVMAEGIKSLSELAPFPDEVSKDNEVHNRKGASALYHIIDRN